MKILGIEIGSPAPIPEPSTRLLDQPVSSKAETSAIVETLTSAILQERIDHLAGRSK
jgi:hypothetical protein